jgi:hypothetical protein
MLTDVQAATEVTAGAGEKVRIRSVEMTLPLEVWLDDEAGEMRLLGDLPVWRWRTVFDQTPNRLWIRWAEEAAS